MLEYKRIDASERTDVNRMSNKSKECDICHNWYFLDKNFTYESYLCNGCHDLMQKTASFNNVAVLSVKRSDYKIKFCFMIENDAINLLNNSVLSNKGVLSWILVQIKNQLKYLKELHSEELVLETFILVLMVNGTEKHEKNLMS